MGNFCHLASNRIFTEVIEYLSSWPKTKISITCKSSFYMKHFSAALFYDFDFRGYIWNYLQYFVLQLCASKVGRKGNLLPETVFCATKRLTFQVKRKRRVSFSMKLAKVFFEYCFIFLGKVNFDFMYSFLVSFQSLLKKYISSNVSSRFFFYLFLTYKNVYLIYLYKL